MGIVSADASRENRGGEGERGGGGAYHRTLTRRGETGRTGRGSGTTKVLGTIRARCRLRRHAAQVVRRRRSRAVRGTDARVVLRTAPREAHARIADGIALHLVDGHLRCMTMDELDEATALSRRDLDVGYLAKALEERAELVLGHIARESANEDGRVVGIRELVHLLPSRESSGRWLVRVELGMSTPLHVARGHRRSSLNHWAAHHVAHIAAEVVPPVRQR